MSRRRLAAVRGSAQWAAYGDALGFVTELTDQDGLRRRIGRDTVTSTEPWKKRIGGQFGVEVVMPRGAYSDDTQLRLATGRAVRGNGEFDIEAFAKIELVAWLAYALGAGRGSKAAARRMRAEARWTQSVFTSKETPYTNVGGNGAAMRIQPHVWAARSPLDLDRLIQDVIRNAVTTHGHPRGILGAVFHAHTLALTLEHGYIPGPSDWLDIVGRMRRVPELVLADEELANLWLPMWERMTGKAFEAACAPVVLECQAALDSLVDIHRNESGKLAYAAAVEKLGGFDPATRGSGTGTALLGAFAAFLYSDRPEVGLLAIANTLGSDTDTIGTMAGALLGVIAATPAPGYIQDRPLIDSEAQRLYRISIGISERSFQYPDLLHWSAPKSALDLVGVDSDGQMALAGLGHLRPLDQPTVELKRPPSRYLWATLPFGQTVLVKRRDAAVRLSADALPPQTQPLDHENPEDVGSIQPALFGQQHLRASESAGSAGRAQSDHTAGRRPRPLEDYVARVVATNFDPETVGRALLDQLQGGDYDVERAAALAGLLARAYNRMGHQGRPRN